MTIVLTGRYFGLENLPGHSYPADYSNTKELARALFTEYYFPFELASMVLLVAVIAAVTLTMRQRGGTKAVDPATQISVKRADRIRLVRMASEKEQGE
jgi:NADH-quinone oxidoreductase subunit J